MFSFSLLFFILFFIKTNKSAYSVTLKQTISLSTHSEFGSDIIAKDDYLFIKSNADTEAVSIYKKNGTFGYYLLKRTGSKGIFGAFMGYTNNTLFIGETGSSPYKGKALVLQYNTTSNNFNQIQEIAPSSLQNNYFFGKSFAEYNNNLYIGADGEHSGGFGGLVYVFIYNTTTNNYIYIKEFQPTDVTGSTRFGKDIQIDNDYIAISGSNVIYIYKNDTQIQKITPNTTAGEGFGNFIFKDNYLIVGDTGYSNSKGAVYVFKKNNTQWIRQQIIYFDNYADNAKFGKSVVYENNTLVIGVESYETTGSAVIMELDSNDGLFKYNTMIKPDGSSTMRFGESVDIKKNMNYIYIGAPQKKEVFLYELGPEITTTTTVAATTTTVSSQTTTAGSSNGTVTTTTKSATATINSGDTTTNEGSNAKALASIAIMIVFLLNYFL